MPSDYTTLQRVALTGAGATEMIQSFKRAREDQDDTPASYRMYEVKLQMDDTDMLAAIRELEAVTDVGE